MPRKNIVGAPLLGSLCVLGECFSAQTPPADSPGFRPERDRNGDERLTVHVRINDQPAKLWFDTGVAGDIVMFSHVLPKFGLKPAQALVEIGDSPGRARGVTSEPAKLEIFGTTDSAASLGIIQVPGDVEPLSTGDGLLGWPGVRDNIWFFNLGDETPSVVPLAEYPSAAQLEELSAIGLTVEESNTLKLRFAKTEADAPRIWLIVDTGSSDGVKLSPGLWQDCVKAVPSAPRTVRTEYMFGDGSRVREILWAAQISVGALIIRDVPVTQAGPAFLHDLAPGEEVVVLGLYALKRLSLFVDAANRRAAAYAINGPPPPFDHNRFGLGFAPLDGKTGDLVAHVVVGSPAAGADVRTGDVLVSVDGVPAETWWADPRPKLEAPAGTVSKFELRRGSATIVREVVAADILGPVPAPSN